MPRFHRVAPEKSAKDPAVPTGRSGPRPAALGGGAGVWSGGGGGNTGLRGGRGKGAGFAADPPPGVAGSSCRPYGAFHAFLLRGKGRRESCVREKKKKGKTKNGGK